MMRSLYDQELRDIQRETYHMGGLICEMLMDMMKACYRRDFTAIERAYAKDREARRMRMQINDRVLRIVATQNPVATDLRRLFFYIHLCDELSRIGSQVSGVGHITIRAEGELMLFEDVYRMGEKTINLLDSMLSAAASGDRATIEKIVAQDDEIDVIYEQISRECAARINAPRAQENAQPLDTYKFARRIEIIGDCVVNAARWWLFYNASAENCTDVIV